MEKEAPEIKASERKILIRSSLVDRWFAAAVLFCLLLPHLFSDVDWPPTLSYGLPRVYSGDEPHYLVFINSILLDGDLELGNNYDSVHAGSEQAGRRWRGWGLDHHTIWFEGKRMWHWFEFYDPVFSGGGTLPRLKVNVKDPGPHPELPWNVPGLSILLAPLVWPFRGTTYLEPAAVLWCAAAAFGGFFFVRRLLYRFLQNPWDVNLIATATILGTPLWHYSRALFPEVFLAFFILASLSLYLERRFVWAGLFLGLAIFVKPPIGLVGVPLLIEMIIRLRLKSLALFSIPLAISVLAFFTLNTFVYGHPLNAPSDIYFQSPYKSLWRLMFSGRGIFLYAPIAVIAVIGWPAFFRLYRRESVLFIACFFMWFVFVAFLESWDGGPTYRPRFMVPIIPLLMIGWVGWFATYSRVKLLVFLWVASISLVINALGAIPYTEYWAKHPLQSILYR